MLLLPILDADGAPDPGLNSRRISSSTLELELEVAPVDDCRVWSNMFDNDAAAFEVFKIVLISPRASFSSPLSAILSMSLLIVKVGVRWACTPNPSSCINQSGTENSVLLPFQSNSLT